MGRSEWNPQTPNTTWDENISVALQEQEVELLFPETVPGPDASVLPLPVWSLPAHTGVLPAVVPTETSSSSSSHTHPGSLGTSLGSASSDNTTNVIEAQSPGDWWEAVRDKRLLRGRRGNPSPSCIQEQQDAGGVTQRFGQVQRRSRSLAPS